MTPVADRSESKRRPKWAQVLTLVLSCIASSGIVISIRERLAPESELRDRVIVLETEVKNLKQARQDDAQLKVFVQEIQSAWGHGSAVRYNDGADNGK